MAKKIKFSYEVKKYLKNKKTKRLVKNHEQLFLHFGPGPNWEKPSSDWLSIDCDLNRGDIICDFNEFQSLPLEDNSVKGIYASHFCEHVSIYKSDLLFSECARVMETGGVFRIVIPNVRVSIEEYMKENKDFLLFKRREKVLSNKFHKKNPTIFDCLRGDFLSMTSQPGELGELHLAHQNAWDYETIENDLLNAGFSKVYKMNFQKSNVNFFDFEGTYKSEANEQYRSLYVEAVK